jgi:hypothetical protein
MDLEHAILSNKPYLNMIIIWLYGYNKLWFFGSMVIHGYSYDPWNKPYLTMCPDMIISSNTTIIEDHNDNFAGLP